jgi:hypothetical protein
MFYMAKHEHWCCGCSAAVFINKEIAVMRFFGNPNNVIELVNHTFDEAVAVASRWLEESEQRIGYCGQGEITPMPIDGAAWAASR